jgi:pimeloyl-ACP methyl ester carboxylesterase
MKFPVLQLLRAHCTITLSILLFPIAVQLAAAGVDLQPTKSLPLPGKTFPVLDHPAFLIAAPAPSNVNSNVKPWVWYAPTLPAYPAKEEQWMFQQFIDAGISVAGIDVGESYGSPAGRKLFTALFDEMRSRGFSAKPVLLGRSRGGLMALSWAAENPDKVAAFAGIYPVCNLASYPGIAKAAPAYELTPDDLQSQLQKHNPVDQLAPLAKAHIPLFSIHGDVDTLVPLN